MKIGFIGLGNLGTPIAENLLESKESLLVYNRTASKAKALEPKGSTTAKSVKEVAEQCDVVFSIVSDDNALKEITEGVDGIAANLKKGGIHISLSTILPATSEALHSLHKQYGSEYLTCPVMGRPEVARARKIQFLISGDNASIQKIKPLLEKAGGAGVWEFGPEPGAANTAKLCSNYLVIAAMEAIAEGINLANQSKIDTELWMKMLTQTYFAAPVYINYSQIIMKEAFQPAAFSLKLGLKDINLVLQQASNTNSNMPVATKLQSLLQQSADDGLSEHDITAVALTIRK